MVVASWQLLPVLTGPLLKEPRIPTVVFGLAAVSLRHDGRSPCRGNGRAYADAPVVLVARPLCSERVLGRLPCRVLGGLEIGSAPAPDPSPRRVETTSGAGLRRVSPSGRSGLGRVETGSIPGRFRVETGSKSGLIQVGPGKDLTRT